MLNLSRFRPRPLALAVSPILLSVGLSAQAQLEEVIVTAQKRAETTQETPISITALTESALEQRGITNTEDLIGEVPGLNGFSAPGSRGTTSISMRGFAAGNPANLSLDPAVAIYFDGVYVGKMMGSSMDVAELERIEVLRGPQGTLYGRNSTAGAVNFISKKPMGEFGFRVKGTVGDYDERGLKFNLDLPAIGQVGEGAGKLSAALGYQMRERDPFYDNTNPDKAGFDSMDREAWRAALMWEATDSFTAEYTYDYSELDESSQLSKVVGFTPLDVNGTSRVAAMQGILQGAQFWATLPGTDPRITERWIPSLQKTIAAYQEAEASGRTRPKSATADNTPIAQNEIEGHALTLTWDAGDWGALGDVTFKSITGYREMETFVFGDLENLDSTLDENGVGLYSDLVHLTLGQLYAPASGYSYPLLDSLWSFIDERGAFHSKQDTRSVYEQFSQEINMMGSTDSLEYVLGLYYFDDEGTYDRAAVFAAPLSGNETQKYTTTTDAKAAFGQVTWTPEGFDQRLALTAGLRYTEETKDIDYDYSAFNTPFNPAGVPRRQIYREQDFDNLSGTLTLAYQLTDDMNGFLRYATGYRSGGFNGEVLDNPYDEETIEQWEIGVKSDWWDRRLRINGSLYTYTYEDLQTSQIKTEGGSTTSVIANAGEAERWGGELEVQVMPVEDLILSMSYAYVTGDFEKFPELCGPNGTCLRTDNRAKRGASPGNQLNLTADYVFARTSIGDVRGYLAVNWQDEWIESALWTNANVNGEPVIYDHSVMDERTLVNGRLSLESVKVGDGMLSVSLWGKNLLDDDYPIYSINFGGLGLITEDYGPPRTYGVDIAYEY